MPLPLLLALVVGGIGAIALILHVLGHSRPLRLAHAGEVRARWLREFPDDQVTQVVLCGDGRAALVMTRRGPGLVYAMGADSAVHGLNGARIRETARGLRIDLNDFAAPGVTLTLGPQAKARWRDLLEAAR